jgi:hypothetical protein
VFTVKYAVFAERFVRTLKHYMSNKTEVTKKPWVDLLEGFLHSYNTEKHMRTDMTPVEASKDENSADVRASLVVHAKNKRKHPALVVGDEVRVYQKKTDEKFQRRKDNRSQMEHTNIYYSFYRVKPRYDPLQA